MSAETYTYEHRVVYESGLEAVCACGAVVGVYGRVTTIAQEFAQHLRSLRSGDPA